MTPRAGLVLARVRPATNFYTEQEIRAFERAGDYLGWRVGIRKDGTWLFFVSGD